MPRRARIAPGGMIFHVLNRANNRARIFDEPADYDAFLRVLADVLPKKPMRILAYCLMPNHWHLVLWPEVDGALGAFMQALTTTHVRRWRLFRQSVGQGHLYQGTYKSFPVQSDEHFYTVCRYVERNPLRADLVAKAELWRWSSLWQRVHADAQSLSLSDRLRLFERPPLSDWPLSRPSDWGQWVNQPQSEAEIASLQASMSRGRPFGGDQWQRSAAEQLGLKSTLRPVGRPKMKMKMGISPINT